MTDDTRSGTDAPGSASAPASTPEPPPAAGNWGRWGAEDERGALNLIEPAGVRAAAHEIRTGRSYSLALPIVRGNQPAFDFRGTPQRLTLVSQTDAMYEGFEGGDDVGSNEDVLIIPSHNLTHMDALCHVQAKGRFYNGFPADSFRSHTGAGRCGIDKLGAFASRAVLLDLPRHFDTPYLEGGYRITGADLAGCAERQGVEVRSGDALLVRTGYLDEYRATVAAGREPSFAQPGLSLDAVEYVRAHDISVVGADNSAIECIPFDDRFLSVHIALLVESGVPLLEHLWLSELAEVMAEAGAYSCLLCVAPLPVTGATGSPINPVAIV
ncbi:cyclase family protein [Embleya scabrispora]|uniref:cyclase family protein n=1 Tax=Embleya scabrispora TaxID=159449 RepID=UPI00035F164E|nr:cyclase family protein [Embleya scabrispora]MYS84282.1 cyclase family protein [Streptomyces sp. SID5474]